MVLVSSILLFTSVHLLSAHLLPSFHPNGPSKYSDQQPSPLYPLTSYPRHQQLPSDFDPSRLFDRNFISNLVVELTKLVSGHCFLITCAFSFMFFFKTQNDSPMDGTMNSKEDERFEEKQFGGRGKPLALIFRHLFKLVTNNCEQGTKAKVVKKKVYARM